MRDIPKDRSRLIVISYTLITIGLVAAFFQIGSGLMPLVITGALIMAAVNLVIWVVSLEREEKESLQTELRLAHEVQMSLMPKSRPRVPGFDIAAIARPAREVGGDLFEYSSVGEENGGFGVAVSDVSGKGLQAALAAVFTSGAFATEVRRTASPAEILTRMNRVVFSHSRRGQFVAFLLAVFDRSEMKAVFANAGQTKPLLLSGGTTQWIDAVGVRFPLGMQPDSAYQERSVPLRSGDILLLMTDGITDAMNTAREPFGLERIEQFLIQPGQGSRSAQELVDQLAAAVRLHVGSAPEHDDMTLVAVKVA
jgi:sigma-B regulation protein RsbU (phosphoserine phosphatase)